jgi:hypothetical protein
MGKIRLWVRLCFGCGVVLLGLFFFGISSVGQTYLIGKPSDDHWVRDDQYMGAGLAPFVYCLLPGLVFFAASFCLFLIGRERHRRDSD